MIWGLILRYYFFVHSISLDSISLDNTHTHKHTQWLEDGSHSWRALSTSQVAAVTAAELPKGMFQVVFGMAGDRYGRKYFLVGGLALSGLSVALMGVGASSSSGVYTAFCFLGVLLGIGTSAMYTNCQAAVADMSRPQWRSTAVGTYRFIRDMGYVFGAVMSGIFADTIGTSSSVGICGGFLMLVACVVWRYFDLERDRITSKPINSLSVVDSKGSGSSNNAADVDSGNVVVSSPLTEEEGAEDEEQKVGLIEMDARRRELGGVDGKDLKAALATFFL